jgi:hypothetical protein
MQITPSQPNLDTGILGKDMAKGMQVEFDSQGDK